MDDTNWHYTVNRVRFCPVSECELADKLRDGRLKSDALVWREGMSDWAPVASVPAFAAFASSNAAPSIAPQSLIANPVGSLPPATPRATPTPMQSTSIPPAATSAGSSHSGAGSMRGDLLSLCLQELETGKSPKMLTTYNSIGCRLYDGMTVGTMGGIRIELKLHAFCILFLPIIPLAIYLCEERADGTYVLGKVPMFRILSQMTGGERVRFLFGILFSSVVMVVALLVALVVTVAILDSCH